MLDFLCPSCERANPAGTRFCFSCHEPLTVPPAGAAPKDFGGLTVLDLYDESPVEDLATAEPIAAPVVGVAPTSWRLDRFATRPLEREPEAAPQAPAEQPKQPMVASAVSGGSSAWFWGHTDANTDIEAAALLDLLDIDDSAAATWLPVAPRTPSALMNCQPVAPVSASQVLKAQRRAVVRRARLAGNRPAAASPGDVLHVLVLDTDAVARVELCALLEGFGFRAHPARTAAQARALLGLHDIVAAFLAVVLDGSEADEAAALCQRVGQSSRAAVNGADTTAATAATTITAAAAPTTPPGPAALVIVGSARPVERVRARLAGANEFLDKPASRGGLARALDACGVALPSDPRQA